MTADARTHDLAAPATVVRVDGAALASILASAPVSEPARRSVSEPARSGDTTAVILLGRDGLDPSTAAPYLAALLPGVPLLLTESVEVAHPYSIARRVASLDLLLRTQHGTRVGLAMHSAEAMEVLPLVDQLWASWPASSLRFDKASGLFASVDEISRIRATGRYPIEGPLTVPVDADDAPLTAVFGDEGDGWASGGAPVDLDLRAPAVRVVDAPPDVTVDALTRLVRPEHGRARRDATARIRTSLGLPERRVAVDRRTARPYDEAAAAARPGWYR